MFSRGRWHRELSLSLPPSHLFITLFAACASSSVSAIPWLGGVIGRPGPASCRNHLHFGFPDDHFSIDGTNESCRRPPHSHRPANWTIPSLRCGLGRLICGGGGSCPKLRTKREHKSRATDLAFGNLSSFVGLATHRDGPDGSSAPTHHQAVPFLRGRVGGEIPNETGANMNKSLLAITALFVAKKRLC